MSTATTATTLKISPTGRQKSIFFIHLLIFAVGVAAMFFIHARQEAAINGAWVYPWHAWPVAAWALAVIGHWCALWTRYKDPAFEEYERQVRNG